MVPYIYEDIAGTQDVADAFMTIYEMSPENKEAMSKKCIDYVRKEFSVTNLVQDWDSTLSACIENFKKTKNTNRWTITQVGASNSNLVAATPTQPKKQQAPVQVAPPSKKKAPTKKPSKKITVIDPSTL
jgi:hypothetical protein